MANGYDVQGYGTAGYDVQGYGTAANIGNQTTLPGGESYQLGNDYLGYVPGKGWDAGNTQPGSSSGWTNWQVTPEAALSALGVQPNQQQQQSQQPTPQQQQSQQPTQTPQINPSQFASLFQPGYLGAPATVTPTTSGYTPAQSANYDLNGLAQTWQGPAQSQQGGLDPTATIEQLLTGFQPQAQTANNNLTQMLANFGVGGGQAVGAETQLQAQQTAALAPSIASAIQNSQANQLQQSISNAGFSNANISNLDTILGQAFGQNASNQQSTNTLNANNNLQNNQFNASQTQNAATGNANALNSTNAANVAEQNQSQQQMIQDLMNQYYQQLQAFQNINTSGQGAGNQNAINYGQEVTVQQDPFTSIFGALAGAAGK
jgi:hypothetical protein